MVAPGCPPDAPAPASPACRTCMTTNLRLHLETILRKVSHAMSCRAGGQWANVLFREGGRAGGKRQARCKEHACLRRRTQLPHTALTRESHTHPPTHPGKQARRHRPPTHPPARPPAHLHPRVRLVHELKQLVDHCLQELPVVAQEAGVLAHHIPAAAGSGGELRWLAGRAGHCAGRRTAGGWQAGCGAATPVHSMRGAAHRQDAAAHTSSPPHRRYPQPVAGSHDV